MKHKSSLSISQLYKAVFLDPEVNHPGCGSLKPLMDGVFFRRCWCWPASISVAKVLLSLAEICLFLSICRYVKITLVDYPYSTLGSLSGSVLFKVRLGLDNDDRHGKNSGDHQSLMKLQILSFKILALKTLWLSNRIQHSCCKFGTNSSHSYSTSHAYNTASWTVFRKHWVSLSQHTFLLLHPDRYPTSLIYSADF